MKDKKIFIASLSSPLPAAKGFQFTAADQLSVLFTKAGIEHIINRHYKNRILSVLSTMFFLCRNIFHINTAILPLYGTPNSIRWYKALEKILLLFNKEIICVVHGGTIPAQLENNFSIFEERFKNASAVVAPSAFLFESLKRKNVFAEIIENSLPIDEYPFIQKDHLSPRILWMRSFHEVYNPFMAVKAAAILSKKYPDFKMVMAGSDSGLLNKTKELVNELGLQEQIIFPGYVDMNGKRKLADEYDIYINTNIVDNSPVSVIEFMAMGLPVIAANAGGLPYMITDKINGLLCNSDDENDLANKIQLLLNDPALSTLIRSNARKYAENYDEKIVLEKWKKIL